MTFRDHIRSQTADVEKIWSSPEQSWRSFQISIRCLIVAMLLSSGTLSKVIERGEGGLTTSSDGNLVFSNPANSANLSFEGLQVIVQEGEEPQISGTVNVNDESFDVAELPEPIRRMLRAVFHLTRR